ncbi:Eco57I restriction-modification methylase domain-containing protein [Pseudarthrobacter sp. PS3-L1]|uniref:Eco57I restriction-modification methylase domain-containing protein n=1 Tax=Pseudarthrobacter sp. PS3-L1 TaxID=3046207 RepID=UPI0024B8E454|nr:Eco57I restriction-modification methylase domain-containing protein [Pseudarthrobacter sp. PS3-L1]MDJ0321956.1 Eco57I restriction-modification methylase domain-containing protein [Pseudarthrobacter sp. PS3-L1]
MAVAVLGDIEYGDVFTRRWVVEAILDLVGYTDDRDLALMKLVEPSIGSGAFLVPVVERLLTSAQAYGRGWTEISSAVFGLDLQAEHVKTCREKVSKLLKEAGANADEVKMITDCWLRTGDFLLDEVPGPVDFVVGNPPYIRTEDLDDKVEAAYRNRWKTMRGRADIYVGFYERSLGLLASGGRLGFICADRWMRNAYGKNLRGLVVSGYAVESVWQMHDVDAFEAEVSAYPAITVLANIPQGSATFVDTTKIFDGQSAREVLDFCNDARTEATGTGWEGAKLPSWFETDDFWPTGSPHTIKLLERLQEDFPTLESDGTTRISIGVATGADKAYIFDKDLGINVEEGRLLPIVMANDIRGGTLKSPSKVMLNPWDSDGRLIEISDYPRFAAVLGSHEAVRKRFVAVKNPATWHRTIDKINPGIAERPKLLLQDMKAQITPVLEPGGFYPHHNLYYVVSSSWDLEVLGGLLLSRIAEAFISAYGVKMQGGTLRFQAQYLRKITVPRPENIPENISEKLRQAFRDRDRDAATRAAEQAYGLPAGTI